jgi:hypothetical protein
MAKNLRSASQKCTEITGSIEGTTNINVAKKSITNLLSLPTGTPSRVRSPPSFTYKMRVWLDVMKLIGVKRKKDQGLVVRSGTGKSYFPSASVTASSGFPTRGDSLRRSGSLCTVTQQPKPPRRNCRYEEKLKQRHPFTCPRWGPEGYVKQIRGAHPSEFKGCLLEWSWRYRPYSNFVTSSLGKRATGTNRWEPTRVA